VDKFLLFPFVLGRWSRREWDAIHVCDHSNSMHLRHLVGDVTPSITCHDLLAVFAAEGRFPGVTVSSTGRILQGWIRRNLAQARRVVCVSSKTAQDLQELGLRPGSEVRVIGNPLNNPFAPSDRDLIASVRVKAGIPENTPYLLHVGNNSWYKNRPGVLRIFAALRLHPGFERFQLVMAGRPWTEEMKRVASELNLGDTVIELDGPSDLEIAALYTGAEALLYPSLEEGFGWPILEAQNCGCAVITSNREPMTEVAGCAAIFVDPANPSASVREIVRRWPELPALRQNGIQNARRFDRIAMMDKYEQFFQEGRGNR
jgi:glycosyltransferase involved in cell wall biosynthesis